MQLKTFVAKFIAIMTVSVLATNTLAQLPSFAALNENNTMDVSIANLTIEAKDSQRIIGKVNVINNSNTTYTDLFCTSEVYLNADNGANLINKVSYPVAIGSKETLSIDINHVFSSSLYYGSYFMTVRLYNRTGIPIGIEYLALGDLGVQKSFLIFNSEKSFMLKNNEELDLQSGPSYKQGQKIPLKIDVKNPSNSTINADLWAKTYIRTDTSSNSSVEENLGNYTFNPSEEKIINVSLTGSDTPDSYAVILNFRDSQNNEISAKCSARYVIEGSSARIIATSIENGANGEINYKVSIVGPADGSILQNSIIRAVLKDKNTGNIIASKDTSANLGGGILEVKIPLKADQNDYSNYTVEIQVIYDGKKLDSISHTGFSPLKSGGTNTSGNASKTPDGQVINDLNNTPFKDAVESLMKQGIIKGYEDGTFRGYNNITRAEFATMMCYLLHRNNESGNYQNQTRFPDVTSKHWAAGFINIANEAGLMSGYPDGSFKADQNISYAEVITVMVRIINNGKDIESNLEWPNNYLVKAKEMQINKDLVFGPRDKAIRGNVAILVNNAINLKGQTK